MVADLLFVLAKLLLEFLNGTIDASPELSCRLVTDHLVEVFRRSDDFNRGKVPIGHVDGHIERRQTVEIPLEPRNLGGDFRLGGRTQVAVPRRDFDLHRDSPLRVMKSVRLT